MKLDLFKPADFKQTPMTLEDFVIVANQKLNEYIESLPKIYGKSRSWSDELVPSDTHQARLICIEPIEKKKCIHYSHNAEFDKDGNEYFECLGCGKRLKVKWEIDE